MNLPDQQLQRFIRTPHSPLFWVPVTLGWIGLVTLLRWLGDQGGNGFLFSPYFPGIVATGALLGWRQGLFAAVCSLLAMRFTFLDDAWFGTLQPGRLFSAVMLALTLSLLLLTTETMRRLLIAQAEQSRRIESFNDELHHRTANLGQMLVNWIDQGLAAPDCRAYYAGLSERLVAWMRSNGTLRDSAGDPIRLHEIAELALAPFPLDRVVVSGEAVTVSGQAARAAAMALHELATNSTKHGALAQAGGQVALRWEEEGADMVKVTWCESAATAAGERVAGSGFGLSLLSSIDEISDFNASQGEAGFTCIFRLPAAPSGGGTG